MSPDTVLALLSSLIGASVGAVLTYLLTRRKTEAEIKNLEARTKEAEANAEKIRREMAALQNPASTSKQQKIHYYQTIKLIHEKSGYALHSHPHNYTHVGSSKEQQITCYSGSDDNDYWLVKPPHNHEDPYKKGEPVRNGETIRLLHVRTKKYLHSHGGNKSPISSFQEVTGFANEHGIGNTDDNWQLDISNSEAIWYEGEPIRLIHQRTDAYLYSNNKTHVEFTRGQHEVAGHKVRDESVLWHAVIVR